jgi:titin
MVAGSAVLGAPVTVTDPAAWNGSSFELPLNGLVNGATYRFSVVTQTSDGFTSLTSTPVTVDVTPVPGIKRLLAVGIAGTAAAPGRVVVTWAAPVMPRGVTIVDYVVQYSANGGNSWQTYPDGVSRSAMVRLNLVNGTAYRVRVAAVTTSSGAPGVLQQGEFSTPSGFAMPYAKGAVPAAVTGVVSSTTRGAVSLSWIPPAGNAGGPPVRYVVQYRPSTSTGAWTQHRQPIHGAAVTIPRLVAGRSYAFRIAAVNAGGVGVWTAPTTVTVG